MSSTPLGAFVRFESDDTPDTGKKSTSDAGTSHRQTSQIREPATKQTSSQRYPSEDIQLDNYISKPEAAAKPALRIAPSRTTDSEFSSKNHSPAGSWRAPQAWESSPTFEAVDELEQNRRASDDAFPPQNESYVVQAWNNPGANRWRVFAACTIYFANGFQDSAPGALLPYIEGYYNIDYALVSLIFIANAIGFISAAFFIHAMDRKLGRARCLIVCEIIAAIGYAVMCIPPPFPVLAVGYFAVGFGIAIGLALNNVYGANLANSTIILGVMHGSYGIGGTVAPLIATLMVSHGIVFSRVYAIMLGLRILNIFNAGMSFWHFERDNREFASSSANQSIQLKSAAAAADKQSEEIKDSVGANEQAPSDEAPNNLTRTTSTTSKASTALNSLVTALRKPTTLIGALFIFAYQGAEVSISGWVISFLISTRHGDPARVGYVTAGFWGGITFGRFVLSPFSHRFGEKRSVYVLTALTAAFQVMLWTVPNIPTNAVSVAIMGVLLGPVYPAATTIFSQLLPLSLQNTALAFISSAGSSGGAFAPFMTGLIAQSKGTFVLNPICIALYVVMIACWIGLPKVTKRRE